MKYQTKHENLYASSFYVSHVTLMMWSSFKVIIIHYILIFVPSNLANGGAAGRDQTEYIIKLSNLP